MPREDSTLPPSTIKPSTVVQKHKAPGRATWLLFPLIVLSLFAVGSRLITATGSSSPPSSMEQQGPVKIEAVDRTTQKQLEAAVGGQLSALRQRNWSKALAFANESLHSRWNGKEFQRVIEESGFSIMPFSTKQEYHKALTSDNTTTMLVTVRTPEGKGAGFVYRMVREKDGWRIAACTHALAPDIATMPPMIGTMAHVP